MAMNHVGNALEQEEAASGEIKKYRVQLDFNPKDFAAINALVEELGLGTRAELFRSALVSLRWMVQKKKAHCMIAAITPSDKLIEPEFEFLQGLAESQPRELVTTLAH